MKVRLLMPWSQWSKGHVFAEMPGGQARELIARNIASEVKDEPDEDKAMRSPIDRMIRAAKVRK